MQQKAARVGFDWADLHGALAKLVEESAELEEAVLEKNQEALEHELGDLLFSVVNVARLLNIEPEGHYGQPVTVLNVDLCISKSGPGKRSTTGGDDFSTQMDAYWDEAKPVNARNSRFCEAGRQELSKDVEQGKQARREGLSYE